MQQPNTPTGTFLTPHNNTSEVPLALPLLTIRHSTGPAIVSGNQDTPNTVSEPMVQGTQENVSVPLHLDKTKQNTAWSVLKKTTTFIQSIVGYIPLIGDLVKNKDTTDTAINNTYFEHVQRSIMTTDTHTIKNIVILSGAIYIVKLKFFPEAQIPRSCIQNELSLRYEYGYCPAYHNYDNDHTVTDYIYSTIYATLNSLYTNFSSLLDTELMKTNPIKPIAGTAIIYALATTAITHFAEATIKVIVRTSSVIHNWYTYQHRYSKEGLALKELINEITNVDTQYTRLRLIKDPILKRSASKKLLGDTQTTTKHMKDMVSSCLTDPQLSPHAGVASLSPRSALNKIIKPGKQLINIVSNPIMYAAQLEQELLMPAMLKALMSTMPDRDKITTILLLVAYFLDSSSFQEREALALQVETPEELQLPGQTNHTGNILTHPSKAISKYDNPTILILFNNFLAVLCRTHGLYDTLGTALNKMNKTIQQSYQGKKQPVVGHTHEEMQKHSIGISYIKQAIIVEAIHYDYLSDVTMQLLNQHFSDALKAAEDHQTLQEVIEITQLTTELVQKTSYSARRAHAIYEQQQRLILQKLSGDQIDQIKAQHQQFGQWNPKAAENIRKNVYKQFIEDPEFNRPLENFIDQMYIARQAGDSMEVKRLIREHDKHIISKADYLASMYLETMSSEFRNPKYISPAVKTFLQTLAQLNSTKLVQTVHPNSSFINICRGVLDVTLGGEAKHYRRLEELIRRQHNEETQCDVVQDDDTPSEAIFALYNLLTVDNFIVKSSFSCPEYYSTGEDNPLLINLAKNMEAGLGTNFPIASSVTRISDLYPALNANDSRQLTQRLCEVLTTIQQRV